jgi:kumamolisin
MKNRTVRRSLVAVLGVVISGAAVTASPAEAGSTASSRVTLLLRAPHPAALSRLARATGLSHRQRVERLARLVPSEATVNRVAASLAGEGVHVVDQTAWSMTVSGPVTDLVAANLPTTSTASAAVPVILRPYVSAALPTVTSQPAFHRSAAVAVDGHGFRAAYSAKHKRLGVGAKRGDSTIATLQLAGFLSSDLSTYAKKTGLPNIVHTPRYRPVTVDGGSGAAADSGGGDVEVALDQESILATAPGAKQRPYFAPNSNAGYIDVFAHAFDDVVQNKHASQGGDPHIVALSTSWGNCEANYGRAQIRATQTVIKALVAAGVTVFAASGDDGIYDCRDSTGTGLGNSKAGVDYPASSPSVVGVGGTNLQHKGRRVKPNNGHNWREVAWSCHNTASCEGNSLLPILPGGTGGTGGGESGVTSTLFGGGFGGFPTPGYQKRNLSGAVFGHEKHRLVPDIAAAGDPQTGFKLYSSDSELSGSQDGNGLVQVGGTSLSAPISAAMLTDTLASAGRTKGVGDIHAALYRAYRKGHGVFRDIRAGTNGAAVNRGPDPAVTARKGYDTLSGLGAVLWPALLPYLVKPHHH